MPIALPAPTAPELGSAEVLRGQGGAYVSAAFQQNQIHVIGPDVVSQDQLTEAISGAENLSDVVRRIQATYYLAGYPAVRAVYALAEPDLYVQITLGKVSKVEAPERYQQYFDGLSSADPLTDEDLEPARTFASLHADRAGEAAIPTFKPDGDGSVLRIEPNDKGPGRSSIGGGFGNPGNRFVGRHFVDYFAKHSFTTGDEIRATGRHSVETLDDENDSEGYHEHSLGWGKVTPWGLLALQGRFVGYQQTLEVPGLTDPVKFDGSIREVELGWSGLLHAGFFSRWGVGAKVDYTRKDFSTTDGYPTETDDIQVLQRQEYGSLELSTEYARVLRPMDTPVELGAGVTVRSGLGDNETDDPVTAADLGYLLFRPTLSAKVKFSELLTVRLAAIAQISDDTVPEQQQWVMGGVGNIEAYLPGVASGDSGGLARLQFETSQFHLFGIGIVPRLFAEYGYAKFENASGDAGETQSLADTGVSLAFTRAPFEASISYAESIKEKNIVREALRDSDANAFFRISVTF